MQDFLWLVNGLNGQKVVAIEAQFRQFRNMMVNKILLNGNRKNVYFAVRINLPHLFCHVILGFFPTLEMNSFSGGRLGLDGFLCGFSREVKTAQSSRKKIFDAYTVT